VHLLLALFKQDDVEIQIVCGVVCCLLCGEFSSTTSDQGECGERGADTHDQ